jgi:hypothetical protein
LNVYRVVVRPNIRYALAHAVELPLTKDMIEQAVAGAAVQELGHDQFGQRVVTVGLQRPSHDEALNEIVGTIEALGFDFAEALVSEWVSEAAERAIAGVLLGGGAGSATKNGAVVFFGALVGGIFGAATGAEVRKLKAQYRAGRNYRDRCWVLHEIEQPQAAQRVPPQVAPGFG